MTYYLQNKVTNIRWNSFIQEGTFTVRWYKWIEEDGNEASVCFSNEELTLFINYCASRPQNFLINSTNYHQCQEDEVTPETDIYDVLAIRSNIPNCIVLRPEPKVNPVPGSIFAIMDVVLIPGHGYDLPFNVIGEIELPE